MKTGLIGIVLAVASLVVGAASWVGAQDPAKPPGQEPAKKDNPAEPKKAPPPSPFPTGYLDHEGLSEALKRVASAHPGVVRVDSIGKSRQGRDIWLATLGAGAAEGSPRRPTVLVVANLEADHLVGSQVALGLVERLAGDGGKAIEGKTVLVVPRLNPDGAERLIKGSPKFDLRANLAAIDRDRDGKQNEDGPNDLDGDGFALSMRFPGEKASLVADSKDPRLSRPAAKGEKPGFSEGTEGIDDDGDGAIDEDPPGGANLNRNWPYNWTEYRPETGAYPASEPEVEALIRFAYAHPEIVAVWSIGLNENLRGNPQVNPPDAPHLAEIVKAFAAATAPKPEPAKEEPKKDEPRKDEPAKKAEAPEPKSAAVAVGSGLLIFAQEPAPVVPQTKAQRKGRAGGPGGGPASAGPAPSIPTPGLDGTTDGCLSEWAYHQYGAVGLASRPWSRPEGAGVEGEGEARWLSWNDKVMGASAFVPFHPVDHPTLGKVEVGGWKPGVRINPPIEQVGSIADGYFAFLKDLVGRTPSLAISKAKVEAKGGGIFQVEATVENPGTLPTALNQGVANRKAPPVLVKLEIGEAKILSGKALNRIESLEGSGGSREFRWLILAPGGLKTIAIEAACPKAGSARREVALP